MKTLLFICLPIFCCSQNSYLDSLYNEYRILKEREAIVTDSMEIQKKEIELLLEKIEKGKEAEIIYLKTREEIDEMKRTMERYQNQIDSLKRENIRLEGEK